MKVKTTRKLESAAREFTDREAPRASFWKQYAAVKAELGGDSNVHVLSYYGIGGIGKTSLLNRLMAEMEKNVEKPLYVHVDLGIFSDLRRVLYSMKSKLQEKAKFQFPLLELGLYIYAKKMGEKADAPQVQQLTEKSPFLSFLLSVSGNIPVLGLTTTVLSLADQGITLLRNYLKNHSKELARIESAEPAKLYEELPMLFACDMQENMQRAKEPVVFFLDTYEQLVNEISQAGEPLKNDLWIRGEYGLVQNIPGALWVIAGREKLKWQRFDPEWADALEQHLLGSLSQKDSVQFLERAGVLPQSLCVQLGELTQGTPVFLDLCVDQYLRLLDRGEIPEIGAFGKNTYDLTERFIRYMGDAQKDHVYMLACLGSWTTDLIDRIAEDVLPNFSITTYEKIREYSFVTLTDEGSYQINKTVAEVLRNTCPDGIRKRTGTALMTHFQPVLEDLHQSLDKQMTALEYMVRGVLLLYTDQETLHEYYVNHLEGSIDRMLDAAWFQPVCRLLERLLEKAQEKNRLYASVLYSMSRMKRLAGENREALALAQDCALIYHQLLGEDHPLTMKADGNCAILLGALDRHDDALKIKQDVLRRRQKCFGEDDLRTVWAMHNLAVTLLEVNDSQQALQLQKTVLEKRQRLLPPDHLDTLWAKLNYANTLCVQRRYSEALALQKEVAEKRSLILDTHHPDTLWAKHHLGITYACLNKEDAAETLLREVLEKRQEVLGKAHPDTLLTMRILEKLLEQMERIPQAQQLQQQRLELEQLWA